MTQRGPGRKRSLIALTAFATLVLGALAPTAFAQIPGTLDGAVGSATGAVDQVSSDVVGGTTETTAGTFDSTPGTKDSSGGGSAVGNVVQNVGGVIEETVDNTTDAGNTIYEGTKKTVDNTTSETGTAVNSAVQGVSDSLRDVGGTVTNPLLNVRDPRNRDRNGDGKITNDERNLGGSNGGKVLSGQFANKTAREAGERGKRDSLAAAEKKTRTAVFATPPYAPAPQRETFMTQLAQAAGEAAEKLAFPLGLALMVGAFLMVQGRIDRKDAKLVLAPIDAEQDLLSFQ